MRSLIAAAGDVAAWPMGLQKPLFFGREMNFEVGPGMPVPGRSTGLKVAEPERFEPSIGLYNPITV
jgi:hypothetical protein